MPINLFSNEKKRISKIKFIIIIIQIAAMAFFVILTSSFCAPLMIVYMWYAVIYFPIRKIAEPAAVSASLFLWENKLEQAIIIEPDDF